MYFILFVSLVLQVVCAHPTVDTAATHLPDIPESEARNYLSSYLDKLNPLKWLNKNDDSDDRDDKLNGIFEILTCIAESKNSSDCRKIVDGIKPRFEKKKNKADRNKATTTRKPQSTTTTKRPETTTEKTEEPSTTAD